MVSFVPALYSRPSEVAQADRSRNVRSRPTDLVTWCSMMPLGRNETVLEAKREEFVDDALIYAKNLCEELEISFQPPRRIRRKHIFGDGSKDVQLSYEDDLRRTMFFSIDRVTAEIRERIQQLQHLAQKYVFLRPQVILSMDELY
ncbi:uncharacterized protein TNCV_691101 [Trichonephila clavipes]|nr:uncharacterized protein TNCV_691101 [Trichonephila clavipes]